MASLATTIACFPLKAFGRAAGIPWHACISNGARQKRNNCVYKRIIMALNGIICITGKRQCQVRSKRLSWSFVTSEQVVRGGRRNGWRGAANGNEWGERSTKRVISESANRRR